MELTTNDSAKELGMLPEKQLIGTVGCKMYDKDGNVVFTDETHNNILLNIRSTIVRLLAGSNYKSTHDFPYVNSITLGTNDAPNPETLSLNDLYRPIEGSRNIVRMTTIAEDGLSVTFAFLYGANVTGLENTEIKEMGLWDLDNNLIARTTVGGWKKSAGLYFEVYWTIGYAN